MPTALYEMPIPAAEVEIQVAGGCPCFDRGLLRRTDERVRLVPIVIDLAGLVSASCCPGNSREPCSPLPQRPAIEHVTCGSSPVARRKRTICCRRSTRSPASNSASTGSAHLPDFHVAGRTTRWIVSCQRTDQHSLAGADDQRSNYKDRRGPGPVQCLVSCHRRMAALCRPASPAHAVGESMLDRLRRSRATILRQLRASCRSTGGSRPPSPPSLSSALAR